MKTDPNEPITPYKMPIGAGEMRIWPGLTKREHFAAMAMQGLLASNYANHTDTTSIYLDMRDTAEVAVIAADALIKQLNKEVRA